MTPGGQNPLAFSPGYAGAGGFESPNAYASPLHYHSSIASPGGGYASPNAMRSPIYSPNQINSGMASPLISSGQGYASPIYQSPLNQNLASPAYSPSGRGQQAPIASYGGLQSPAYQPSLRMGSSAMASPAYSPTQNRMSEAILRPESPQLSSPAINAGSMIGSPLASMNSPVLGSGMPGSYIASPCYSPNSPVGKMSERGKANQ